MEKYKPASGYNIKEKKKKWVTYDDSKGVGTIAIADGGRLGCRCDDVVHSPVNDDLVLVDRRKESVGLP